MDVKQKVLEIIANVLEIGISQITLEATVGDFPAWDSLGQLNILQSIQDEFDIEFEPEEMMDIEDVSDIIKAVESKL